MDNSYARYNAPMVALAAVLMLFYGWGTGGWAYPADANKLYEFSLSLFDWTLRIGGIVMAIIAAICFVGQRIGLLLEAIVSGICGIIMMACSAIWFFNYGIGINTLLIGVFGFMFVSAARSALRLYCASKPTVGNQTAVQSVEPASPHPASIASSSLPKDGEPAPDEGYLAALSKEKDES